jgi:hypothetical protein
MDPKETKTFESSQPTNLNQTSSKTQKTQHIPGISPLQPAANNTQLESQPEFWGGLRKPMKWAVTIGGTIFVLALISSLLFNFAASLMKGNKAPKEILPDRSTPSPSPTISSASKNECMDLPTRMAKANITAKQVDKVFYQKYPDRLNKGLGDTEVDRNLRQEWCKVANKLIQ